MNPNFRLNLSGKGMIDTLPVRPSYKSTGLCTYSVINTSGYLFTLVPNNNPFTDFELSDEDKTLDQVINWPLLDQVKTDIINHYL
jgi:hypothetical protein